MKRNTRIMCRILVVFLFICFVSSAGTGQLLEQKKEAFQWIDLHKSEITALSDKIWEYAELPMLEYKSSRLLANALEEHGFEVVERLPWQHGKNPHNSNYLSTKKGKLGHMF